MYTWIDNYVRGIVEICDTTNIYDIYDTFNISVVKLDINNVLLRNNEAFYYRYFDGKEIVFIRNDLNIEYEKFILAHELGHAILHTSVYHAAFNKNLINTGKLEKQANYFAVKLLNLDFYEIEYEGFTIEQIASTLSLPVDYIKNILY